MTDEELRERTRELLEAVPPDEVDQVTFRGAQYDRGLAWVHFPEGLGGLGLVPKRQAVVNDELREGARTSYENLLLNPIGIGMGAPTLLTYGTDEMKQRLLRRIFTGEDIWCQLFSEPGAGSDVAGLSCRAERDGDSWVVSGQKVWTTLAHVSKWGMLLARTDPEATKHQGLSYFLLDMESPGVEVRPLYQITGEAEFNEVFLNDVRIPHASMLGVEGEGWKVAITTLMNERSALGGGSGTRGGGPISVLLGLWGARSRAGGSAPRTIPIASGD
jgi:alkylation response protein AidB-like acyl-CoA dehydrogenase